MGTLFLLHTQKSPPRTIPFAELTFGPRFAYPEMAQVVEVAGLKDNSNLSGGFARFKGAHIPWQIQYDELILVLEGQIAIETKERTLEAGPRDTIWLPAGTELVYTAEDALVFYSIYPSGWQSEGKA